ncbi:restriction endonuclease subunit S [Segatella sinensis]|uniref:Restriction endonuclease subunit S n=1 Tax=Segatella sinensis TaxID=3085167 RepID=A0ABV1FXM6_9BACT
MAKTYDTYKDSGIAWIGNIPSEWEIKKLGNFYTQRNEKVSDKDFSPLSVTMQGILPQLETAAKTNDGDNRKLVRVGDFAINSRSDRRGSCGISPYDGSVSLINTVLCPKDKMNAKFYNWLFHTTMFADEYYKWGHGIVDDLWTTRWSEMKNISVVEPPLSEQQAIATYLDEKCGEIDSLISLQEEMISELQAYKQSVITEAVSKGLDPNVPMKDSGVEWIGMIPEAWDIKRIKFIANIWGRIGFRGYKGEDLNKEGIGAITLSPSNMKSFYMDYSSVTYLSWEKYNESPEIMIQNGDILFVKTGSSYGKACYVENLPREATINPQILRIVPKNNQKFLCYFLQTPYIKFETECGVVGGTIPTISQEKIRNMYVISPPISEQQAIASYLDEKTSQIDSLIALKQEKITELKDYKKSIIYEYVTGKKKV